MNNQELVKKISQIIQLSEECMAVLSVGSVPKSKLIFKNEKEKNNNPNFVLAIVNKIKDCDEAEVIESKVLDELSMSGRIIFPYYICYKYFPEQGLTTGDVEKITSELRVKITTSNISNAISHSLHKYLEGNSTRIKGKPVLYKLNRKGVNYFESLLNQNEKQE
jgi:hypothetical protein